MSINNHKEDASSPTGVVKHVNSNKDQKRANRRGLTLSLKLDRKTVLVSRTLVDDGRNILITSIAMSAARMDSARVIKNVGDWTMARVTAQRALAVSRHVGRGPRAR